MNKKGQFYIFMALLLIAFIASLREGKTFSTSAESAYVATRENFITEAGYVVNSAMYRGVDPFEALDTYVEDYQAFLAARDIEMAAVVIMADGDTLLAKSYYDAPVTMDLEYGVDTVNVSLPHMEMQEYARTNALTLNISGAVVDEVYTLSLDEEKPVDFEIIYKFL